MVSRTEAPAKELSMTGERALDGMHVLVLEDDYYLATDAQEGLEKAGAEVVGPFRDAGAAIERAAVETIDCAVLDINLGDGPSFDTARALMGRGIPFLFVTGYDGNVIPDEFAGVGRLEKPLTEHRLVEAVRKLR
jgi:DNA-binding response OmpR family regulator